MHQLQDQDLIVVRKADSVRPVVQVGTPRAVSTQQADFTKHPTRKPSAALGADYESCLSPRSKQLFEGTSQYSLDYVKHPYSKPQIHQPGSNLELHNEPLGKTSYSQEFCCPPVSVRSSKSFDDQALRTS